MWLAPWCIGVAAAATLEIHPSPEAQVTLLGGTRANYAEIGIYDNAAPIGIDVNAWRPVGGLVTARFIDAGGGTQFILLEVEDGRVVEVVPTPDHVELRIVMGRPPVPPAERPLPTVQDILTGAASVPAEEPRIELHPLLGTARTYGPRVPVVRLEVDEPSLKAPAGWEIFDAVEHPTWDDVKRWQRALATVTDPEVRMLANYRLGDAHRALGLAREARYYFEQGSKLGIPPAAMLLHRAESALVARNYDDARYSCEEAWKRDARDGQVLACLGLLALQTGEIAPGELGRALAAVANTPSERLVAGELLLRGGRFDDALGPLSSAARELHGSQLELAQIALGDAWLLQGQVDRAREAYLAAPHVNLDGVLRIRELMVRMIADGVRNWPSWMPELDAIAREGGPQGAEALYVIAQVQERFLDWESAAAAYTAMWDLYPGVRSSEVPVALLDACGKRVDLLGREGRHAELVAVFDGCWRDGLAEHVSDVSMFASAVSSYRALGLPEEALDVELELTTLLASVGREDAREIAHLAELTIEAGRPEQALDTIRYGRRLAGSGPALAHLDLAEGTALLALGRLDEGITSLVAASRDPELRPLAEGRRGVAQLRAGECAEGLDAVGARLKAGALPGQAPGEAELLAARCAVDLGRGAETLAFADLAVKRSSDDWTPKEARWLATLEGRRSGLAVPPELLSDAPALERLREEDAAHAAFLTEMSEWREGVAR